MGILCLPEQLVVAGTVAGGVVGVVRLALVAEVFGMDDGGDSLSGAGNVDCGEVVGFG